MSGKVSFAEGEHGPAVIEGVTTALSWLSVLPFRGATAFDRITGARVMAASPIVGVVFGLFAVALLALLGLLGVAPLLSAVLVVIMWELLSRLMHLDGLADVADALGSYAAPERAREILADPHTGLFGFSAATFSLLVQIAAVMSLIDNGVSWLVFFLPPLGRVAGQVVARSGRTPLSPTGFGALVVGTVKPWWIIAWWLLLTVLAGVTAVAVGATSLAWVVGMTGVVACLTTEAGARHLSRRFQGVNGDCIGAGIHLGTAVSAVLFAVTVSSWMTLT